LEARPRPEATEHEIRFFRRDIALRAGVACRVLGKRREAREWFGRAAREFESGPSSSAERARLVYQELALALEERRFESVMNRLPGLVRAFTKLDMPEDLLKAEFLRGIALMETDRLTEAIDLYRELYRRAAVLENQRLAATASYNMVQIYGMLGDTEAAVAEAAIAVPLLRRLDNRVGLAKIRWGLGRLLRTQGKLEAAIENYRAAQGEFRDIGMRADLAALHLVIADLLIERGEEAHAMSEVLAALPIIEEEQMVPEGMAALSLLRESVRAQQLNRQALRDLHGYFEELA
jgi:tetratricopeptide (TPR) repeat protein